MRKCLRCQIIFHSDQRLNCLYCDTRLSDADFGEIARGTSPKERIFQKEENIKHVRMEYLVGSYFKNKTFSFLYNFSRNELKLGKEFKRFFIQPIDFTSVIKIPWIVINIIDSMAIHLVYTGYCEQCNWKYARISAGSSHSQDDCEYNKEYSTILERILSGEIIKTERSFEKVAQWQLDQGKKSAYRDLCSRKRQHETIIDIITIQISMGVIIYSVARLIIPIFGHIYDF